MRSLVLGFLWAVCAVAQTPADLDLFILAGQSNMAGRGSIEPSDREPVPGIYALNKELVWVPAVEPMHFDKPYMGADLGRPFAKALKAANPSAAIGLIPCAVGGSSLNEWAPDGKLYSDCVQRARAAMKSGRVRAIL